MGLQAVLIHGVPGDAIALGHHLGGLQHGHVNILVHRHQILIGEAMGIHVLILDQRNGILATANSNLHAVHYDLLGGHGYCHQSRRTLTVNGLTTDRDGQTTPKGRQAANVHALGTLGQGRSHGHVVDTIPFDTGTLYRRPDSIPSQGGSCQVVEASAIGLSDRGACCCDNYGFSHGSSP